MTGFAPHFDSQPLHTPKGTRMTPKPENGPQRPALNYTEIVSAIAKEKLGRPDATPFAWAMVGPIHEWTGCEVSLCDVQMFGNGSPDWRTSKREQTVMVSSAEVAAWRKRNENQEPQENA